MFFVSILEKSVYLPVESYRHPAMANERIFVSYKRKDKEQVFALIDKIERELGVKCWVDLEGIETLYRYEL